MRDLDPVFDGEVLYHGIEADWIKPDGSLTKMAVTVVGTSFDRAKYQEQGPLPTLGRRSAFADVGITLSDDISAIRLPNVADGHPTFRYEWRLIDEPLSEADPGGPNEAHCQAVVCVEDAEVDWGLRPKSGAEARLRKALAAVICPLGLQAAY